MSKAKMTAARITNFRGGIDPQTLQEVLDHLFERVRDAEETIDELDEDVAELEAPAPEGAIDGLVEAPPKADLAKVAEADIRMQIFGILTENLTADAEGNKARLVVEQALKVAAEITIPIEIIDANMLLIEQKRP